MENKKKYALITGASSGIGLHIAKTLAKAQHNLILVARSEDKLKKLQTSLIEKYLIDVVVIPCDLSKLESTQELCIKLKHYDIEYLVNNAGFGEYGEFKETSLEKEIQMIQVNITSLTMLSKLVLLKMLPQQKGKILNIASTASFQPGPLMAVYYASKAYVLNFSEALAQELKDTKITVTAYCPGPTQSGFQEVADMHDSRLMKQKLPSSQEVAEAAVRACERKKTVAIHGLKNWLLAQSVRFSPRCLVRKLVHIIQSKSSG